jgi:hypothetical protein
MAKLIIAKSGGTVGDAVSDLAMTSDKNCLKETQSGILSISIGASMQTDYQYTHGLGYIPAYYCFAEDQNSPGEWHPHNSGIYNFSTRIDNNKLYIRVYGDNGDTVNVYYQIFVEQL